MYFCIILFVVTIMMAHLMQLLRNARMGSKLSQLSNCEINSLLSERMHISLPTKKAFEIDRVLLRHGYSFVTPIIVTHQKNVSVYTFNELASNGKRRVAWRLRRTILNMGLEGVEDIRIPRPGFCYVYTNQDVPYSSLQKVFTILGVHQCDIVEKAVKPNSTAVQEFHT